MMPVDAVVMDSEGTTVPVDFLSLVLYPYARDHLPNCIRERPQTGPDVG